MNSKKVLMIMDERAKVSPELDRRLKNSIAKTEKIVVITKEWNSEITVLKNGVRIELEPPFCLICGAHMGEEYDGNTFSNPHNYESYGTNICPKCGREYKYIEADHMTLSNEELDLIRRKEGML